MKKLVIKAIVFLLLLWFCDFTIGSVLKKMYFNIETGTSGALINHLIKSKYDAYIFGSSQSQHGYIPSIIEDEIGLSVYNAGEDGTDILYKYAMLQLMLETHKPKLIIWEVSYIDYSYYGGSTKLLLPYYENKKVREMLNTIDPRLKIAMLSKLYPYNQKIASILTSYFSNHKSQNLKLQGYSPVYGFIEASKIKYLESTLRQRMADNARTKKDNSKKDIIAQHYFHEFIQDCRLNGIDLIAFESPPNPIILDSHLIPSLSPQIIHELDNSGVDLHKILHKEYPELNHRENYKDFSHLNHSGATAYSGIVAKIVRRELESKGSTDIQTKY